MTFKKKILKFWMERFSCINRYKGPWQGYMNARSASTEKDKTEALLSISHARYEECKIHKIDNIFKADFRRLLEGKNLLEIGSNHGGASLYYYEYFKLNSITGIDTTESQVEISKLFFEKKGVTSGYHFEEGYAENLPFSSESFDAILSSDVIEHLEDVPQALYEKYRVLKPGGKAFISFPSYYHPTQHHLSVVTTAPCIHWFYSPKLLMEVYYDMLDEYPEYRDKAGQTRRPLQAWEKLQIINGTTLKKFRRYIKQQPWKYRIQIPQPLGAHSRLVKKHPFLKPFSYIFWPGTKIPILSEVCNQRIVYILER